MESLCSKGYGTSRIYLGLRAMRFLVFYLSLILGGKHCFGSKNSDSCVKFSWFGVFETFAAKGDDCARECREKMQIMVAGGDGTGARVRQSLIHK
ncbi:hypothetical protein IGI04_006339 [Brassica rapa subsp. trilocularis]|uniref:DAGKc domain-containing protein n=1 Tax=Brassica rapa subsp. trilocularis TaxID=1813537 RepID=A0ABQ7NJ02_BRACM|nr:hypothetical protein IGI04_006339 [Brassica rapa subsp. trilocularis]